LKQAPAETTPTHITFRKDLPNMAEKTNITSPVGRIVAGSLYRPNTTDFDGKPLVYKTGSDAGKPRVQYFFAIAIPKNPGETHWAYTEWGKVIWAVGNAAFPQAAQRPDFAWKVEDGDSMIPNKRNRKPAEQEGWKGSWVIKFTSSFAPMIYKQEAGAFVQLTEPDMVKAGYFIQVAFTVDGNGQQGNPGVYLNPGAVCFRAYGSEISFGPNVDEAGFGAAPLPAGASLTPPPASTLPAPPAAAVTAPYTPPAPSMPAAPPVPVYPSLGFTQVPPPNPTYAGNVATPSIPAGVPAPPPSAIPASPSSRSMTAKAAGVSYEAYIAAGWSDAQLIANGLMVI
jgi:hypothetical protein